MDHTMNCGSIDMQTILPPHPAASWEPGNLGAYPLRITALLGERGEIILHIDTALTLGGGEEPPMSIYADDQEIYTSPTAAGGDCADPDHGHPVPWRTPSR
ncbi:hypothetical protein Ga0074812_1475 [Parafrankia irregularis]|uniref:Uncharacterized protein n=1 Tax=Parafrankia irregularis TaxID=795642 RepID=A0A0S4QZ06_9ACTN|nr:MULTISPECIES: hypothetical protein [Parafrankia]MBE3206678.1 hypothetical protein [Parafrankia sp. CH37]CUU60759.1 hypothetical protein Ga0074812_1475 [Parafrankia irregularis]